jgi:Skp family chaperone for outer membrane proteins
MAALLLIVAGWGVPGWGAARAEAADIPSAAGVHDEAAIFSAEALGNAEKAIGQLGDRHHLDLRIETYPQVPDEQQAAFDRAGKARFFAQWTMDRAKDAGVNGVMVLICMRPGHVEVVDAGPGSEKAFSARDRDELSTAMGKVLGEKQYDDALTRAVAFVEKRMDANATAAAPEAAKPPAAAAEHAQGGMAVVDMDKVAQMIGWQDTMSEQSKAVEKDLLDQLNAYQAGLAQAMIDRENALADEASLSADQKQQLQRAGTINDLERVPLSHEQREELLKNIKEINQARLTAQSHSREVFEHYQAALLDSYRQEIKPAVSRVAFDEGYTLVTVPQSNLVYVDPSVDITEKVARLLKKDMPAPKQPEKPTLDLPPFKLPPLVAPTSRPTTAKGED